MTNEEHQALIRSRRDQAQAIAEGVALRLMAAHGVLHDLRSVDGLANSHREALTDARDHLAESLDALARAVNGIQGDLI